MDSVTMDTRLILTCFLILSESLLISMCDNTVKRTQLVRTSFPVQALWSCWIQQTNLHHNHGRRAVVIKTAISLIAKLSE